MIWITIIGIALLLFAGPLRKPFLAAWRFTFPGLIGAILAFLASAKIVNAGAPALIMVIAPVMAFFMIGAAGWQWFNDNFPPRER